jgi:transcriptional regulator with XRE-family HTH domain
MAEFKEVLKDLRREKGVSVNRLAKILGVSNACVSYWENGKREPNLQQIRKICLYFNVSADILIGMDDE